MIIPVLKFCHRSTLIFFEILVVLIIIVSGVLGVVFWKFSKGPIDVTFAADAVKSALVSSGSVTDFKFDSIVAEWPKFSGPISIGMSGVKLFEDSKPIMSIPQLGVRIAKVPLLLGMVHPEAVVIKSATIKLYRSKNGGVHLWVSDTPTSTEQADVSTVPEQAAATQDAPSTAADVSSSTSLKKLGEALFRGGNLPDYPQIEPLSKLERFSINNAHILIVDEESGSSYDVPDLDFEILRDDNQFTIDASYQEGKQTKSNFSFLVMRSPKDESVRFFSEIDKINLSTLGRLFLPVNSPKGLDFVLQGKMEGDLDRDWKPLNLEGNLSSDVGQFNLDGFYQTPLKFSNFSAQVSYDKGADKIILHDTHIDINNRRIELKGEKIASANSNIFELNINVPEFSFDEIHTLWPENQKDTIAADWFVKRLSNAKIKNLNATLPIDLDNISNFNPETIDASMEFQNLTADYQAPLYPATEANGKASLKGDVLTIDVTSGKLGDLVADKAQISITHLTHPTTIGDVKINADLKGNISTVLDYISLEPISLGQQVGIDSKKVKGTTTLNADITFPALKDLPKDEVKVVVNAKLNDVLLPSIVRGMDLTAGPYDLTVKDGIVNVAGKGALNNQPIELSYTEYIDRSTAPFFSNAKASIVADRALREKFGVHLDQFIEGSVPVKIEYQQNKNLDETVSIQADLAPITVKFKPFKYRKPVGQGGQATCDVLIQKGEVVHINNLKISVDKAGSASGKLVFGRVGNGNDVKTGEFKNVTLAGSNNFDLSFIQTVPDVFDVTIMGKQLDARPFLGGAKPVEQTGSKSSVATAPSVPDATRVNATVKVNTMKTGDGADRILTSPTVSLRTDANGDVAFLDLKGGFTGGTVFVLLQPNPKGQSTLQIKSDNAGGALKALDLYDQMVGGQMDIRGTQIAGGGINDISGRGVITNFTIVRAPILAKLINLFSLSGLTELLQNKGIEFKNLKTNFEWKETKAGRIVALNNGRTNGASIGLTFGGNVNQDKGTIDVSGTFVPMSEINNFVGRIPLIGDLLTGGKNGGVIAATYAMTGKSSDPTVFVNPLSVLTPGFLRSIFFENKDTVFDDDSDSAAPKEKPKKKTYN